jgi:hypothetical protein
MRFVCDHLNKAQEALDRNEYTSGERSHRRARERHDKLSEELRQRSQSQLDRQSRILAAWSLGETEKFASTKRCTQARTRAQKAKFFGAEESVLEVVLGECSKR